MKKTFLMLLLIGCAVIHFTSCEKSVRDSMNDIVDSSETPTKDDPEAYTVALVQSAIDLFKTEGREVVIAYHNDPTNIDGQWYVFITDENDIFLAHAQNLQLVGTDLKDVIGLDGSALGVEIAMATDEGKWIEYLWPNPESGNDEMKRTWAIRYDGYLFGSGYYSPVSDDSESKDN